MELTSRRAIKNLFKNYRIYPKKYLGQNFLVSDGVLKKIIQTANIQPKDIILEIGPGIGTLTQELAKKAKRVIAVEKDPKMSEILRTMLEGWNVRNVRVVNKDILKFNPKTYNLKSKIYKVIANLPYYIVGPVIRKFLENENPPKLMVLMVQKEVAERICSKPPKMSILAVSVQFYAKPEIISFVPKDSFWPEPKVDGAILKISKTKNQKSKIDLDTDLFFGIVKAGFSQPRKQLVNNFVKKLGRNKEKVSVWLSENNIQPSQRAETLNIKDWINLTKTFNENYKFLISNKISNVK